MCHFPSRRDDPRLWRSDVLAEITALWQTDDVRSARPTVRPTRSAWLWTTTSPPSLTRCPFCTRRSPRSPCQAEYGIELQDVGAFRNCCQFRLLDRRRSRWQSLSSLPEVDRGRPSRWRKALLVDPLPPPPPDGLRATWQLYPASPRISSALERTLLSGLPGRDAPLRPGRA